MTDIDSIVDAIRNARRCRVLPPSGLPEIQREHALPADVMRFFQIAGGAALFQDSEYSYQILPPDEIRLANPVIVGDLCEGDISADWYLVAIDGGGDYLTIDLHPSRLGRCYDSFHETHGLVGDTPIIARSFTELLELLYANRGEYPYWKESGFQPFGDAYEENAV